MDTYIFVAERKGGQRHCVCCVCVCVCVHSMLSLSIHPSRMHILLLRGQEDKVAGHRWAAEILVGNACPSAGLLLTSPGLQADQWIPPQRRYRSRDAQSFKGFHGNFTPATYPTCGFPGHPCLLLFQPLLESLRVSKSAPPMGVTLPGDRRCLRASPYQVQ